MQAIESVPKSITKRVVVPAGWNLIVRLGRAFKRHRRASTCGPCGYRREGFPEIELYQVLAGRRDKFDGL